MVEVADRDALLVLLDRLRRRKRWIAAWEGIIVGATVGAFGATALVELGWLIRQVMRVEDVMTWFGPSRAGTWLAAVVVVAVTTAAAGSLRASRRISRSACARAFDQNAVALENAVARRLGAADAGLVTPPVSDEAVLAALTFAESGPPSATSAPFVAALTRQALRRVQQVPLARLAPPPRRASLAMAAVSVAGLVGSLALLAVGDRRPTRAQAGSPPRAIPEKSTIGRLGGLRLPHEATREERDELAVALRQAEVEADPELVRLGVALTRLLEAAAMTGVDPSSSLRELEQLVKEAAASAESATTAQTAIASARRALERGAKVGGAAAMLSDALAVATARPHAVGEAAARVANSGAAGRDALARAMSSAAAAIAASVDGGDATATSERERAEQRRRLNPEMPPASAEMQGGSASESAASTPPLESRRRLERLRRDLDDGAEACRKAPELCARAAPDGGRAFGDLDRIGRSEAARQRLAEAARQVLDRIRRGDSGIAASGGDTMQRFSRSAHGEGQADRAGASASNEVSGGGAATPGAGSGIGAAPGGAVLGARSANVATGNAARDIEATVQDSGPGPSRAKVIGSAAGRGFATLEYQRVFDDYRAAIEAAMDTAAVPPGRRYLVRRYFHLIRPRVVR